MFAGGLLGAWLLHGTVPPALVLLLPAALVLVLVLGVVLWAIRRGHAPEPG
ncbi:hypothetical protein ACIOK4_39235 [Streptomyces bottropensis]|jgi:hypothetical protein|uniref:hypothetical protein n=1 Tax=Streptomyces bottropensis TaxID=42235 RepID=UPI00367E98F5